MLRDKNHPLFLIDFKYTNSSLRKFHFEKLADANAPLLIQQASLAQNTRHYSRGAHNLEKKIKVAEIVSGKRKSWHDPPTEIKQSHVSPQKNSESRPTHSPMKDVTNIQLNLPGMPAPASATKKICFSFTSNNANIEFSHDV